MLSEFERARLDAHEAANRAAELGLTAQDIRDMPFDAYNRLFHPGRPTPAQAALQALDAQAVPAALPDSAFTQQAVPEPPGRTLEEVALTDDAFLQWRSQRQSGGEGRGIFDSVSSQSAEYRAAAARHAGRHGWVSSNVVEPPRLVGRQERQGDMIDHRTQRLSNQANMWQQG